MFSSADAPPYEFSLPHHEVVIFPARVDGDVGIYRDEQLTFKKVLKAQGIDAEYLHDPEHRRWLGLKGDVLVEVIISLSTGGALLALQLLLTSRLGKSRVKVKLGRRIEADGAQVEWFEAEGSGDDVAAQLEQFRDWTDGV